MNERVEESVRNEVLFREVNERVGEALGFIAPGENGDHLEIFCECGQADCIEKLIVSADEYQAARLKPDCFLVAAGHEIPDAEHVVIGSGHPAIKER